jgi:hypothetical protein
MKKGDIVKFKNIRNEILLQLTDKPKNARALNGVSDKDELFLKGRVLSKTKGKEFIPDSRYNGEKPFIVKDNEITLIQEYTKLRLYFDGKCGYEYDTIEEAKEFINRVKFNWKEAILFDPNGNIVYEINK